MHPKKEKKFLESIKKIIDFDHSNTPTIPFKYRLFSSLSFAVVWIFWFIWVNWQNITSYMDDGYSFDAAIKHEFLYSLAIFIPPFVSGCVLTYCSIFLITKYKLWREMKQYIDRDKLLARISLLEREISDAKNPKI